MADLMEFDKLLETADGRKQFMTFLKSEYSDENLEFWLMVEHYKTMVTYDDRRTKKTAETIYTDYIRPDGSRTVNISSKTQKTILLNLKDLSYNLFDEAQKEIYSLMRGDCYPRFINSKFAAEFKQLQLETPRLERKKKKARPSGTVFDYDSPRKIHRKCFLKPEERYEDFLPNNNDDDVPPIVPKRRESLGIPSNNGTVKHCPPIASIEETNLIDNDCYSLIVNPSISMNQQFNRKDIQITLPDFRIITKTIVSEEIKFIDVIHDVCKTCSDLNITKNEFKLVESLSKNVVNQQAIVLHSTGVSFFLIKIISFKIHFTDGLLFTVHCSSQKYIPAVVSLILQKINCSNIMEALKSLVNKNNAKPISTHLAQDYEGQTIILPLSCKISSLLNLDTLKSMHFEDDITIKSIEFQTDFFKSQTAPSNMEQKPESIKENRNINPEHIYSLPTKQRPSSVSFPVPIKDETLPFRVSTNLVNNNSSIVGTVPLYENTVENTVKNTFNSVPIQNPDKIIHDNSNNDEMNLDEEFFQQIMKRNYVKLNSIDFTVDQRNFQLKPNPTIPSREMATPCRRESFHRAKIAIVQSSPVRRTSSLPRQSLGTPFTNTPKPLSSLANTDKTVSTALSPKPTPTSRRILNKQTPTKTPNLMKTLSKFHKIY